MAGVRGFGERRVGEGRGRDAVFDWDGGGNVYEEGAVFEEGDHEEVRVGGVQFGGVDWGGEFHEPEACPGREVPEDGPPVLGGS